MYIQTNFKVKLFEKKQIKKKSDGRLGPLAHLIPCRLSLLVCYYLTNQPNSAHFSRGHWRVRPKRAELVNFPTLTTKITATKEISV